MAKFVYINRIRPLWLAVAGIVAALMFGLACSGAQPTATQAPATPKPAETVAGGPTATPVTVAPTATNTPTAMTEQAKRGGVLRFPQTISIDAPDPAFSVLTGTRIIMPPIYSFIVKQMPDGKVSPDLAESWDVSADGKTITFHLRKGVKFQDGTDFNAQAVKWNYDRYLDPKLISPRKAELSPPLQSVNVVDDSTVNFQLSSPFRPLLAVLTLQAGMIASPAAVQKYNSYDDRNGQFGRNPVGAGPFKLDEWAPGSYFKFSRYDNYWDKTLPYLDGLYMPIIGDTQIQFAMLRTGEVDVMEKMDAQNISIAERNPDVKVVAREGTSTTAFWLRITTKPWDNKDLRQAIAYAVDRNAVGQVVFAGRAQPAQTVVGPSHGQWFDPTVKVYDRNFSKVKELLAKAGYSNGFSFEMPCRTGGIDGQSCEVVQASLAEAGITMNIKPYDNVTYFSNFVSKKHDGPMISYWSARPDPGVLLRLLYHTKGSQNSWGYSNPQVDKLIEDADGVYDVAKAKEMYHQVQTIIAEDAPTIYLTAWNAYFGIRRSVQNFNTYLDAIPRFHDVWLSK